MGKTEIPDQRGLEGEPWLAGTVFFQLERSGAFLKKQMQKCALKELDTADIVREAMLRQCHRERRPNRCSFIVLAPFQSLRFSALISAITIRARFLCYALQLSFRSKEKIVWLCEGS